MDCLISRFKKGVGGGSLQRVATLSFNLIYQVGLTLIKNQSFPCKLSHWGHESRGGGRHMEWIRRGADRHEDRQSRPSKTAFLQVNGTNG